MSDRGWARFFCRVIVGLIFLMAGWWKCFTLTPIGHAHRYFTGPYQDSWIPTFLLLAFGVTIPVLELLSGLLLVAGWRTREALIVIGLILVTVTYGHLLKEPLYSIIDHIFPRTVLMVATFLLPASEDRLSLDYWLQRKAASGK